MLILFGEHAIPHKYFNFLDNYLKNHNLHNLKKPFHDAMLVDMPSGGLSNLQLNLSEWRHLFQTTGSKMAHIFSRAYDIQRVLGRTPTSLKEAEDVLKKIVYQRANENEELASLCISYHVTEKAFNKCLDLKDKLKRRDNLPNVFIDGKSINHPGYYFAKLPIGDLRGFILGKITDCCQSIGSEAEECVIDGLTLKNNGFYVLLKSKKHISASEEKESSQVIREDGTINYNLVDIVGQGYAWIAESKNIVFDSWENLRDADDIVIYDMLKKYGEIVIAQKPSPVFRVSIGSGGKTPSEFKTFVHPDTILEGTSYPDSAEQLLVTVDEKEQEFLAKEINDIFYSVIKDQPDFKENKIPLVSKNSISSLERAEKFKNLLNSEEFQHILQRTPLAKKLLNYVKITEKFGEIINNYFEPWDLLFGTQFKDYVENLSLPQQVENMKDTFILQVGMKISKKGVQKFYSFFNEEKYKSIFDTVFLYQAIKFNQIDIVKLLLEKNPKLASISIKDIKIDSKTKSEIEEFDSNKILSSLKTPLHFSLSEGHEEIAKLLIQAGAEIQYGKKEGTIHLATEQKANTVVSLLADLSAKQTAIVNNCRLGNIEFLSQLPQHDLAINFKNHVGNTPLHEACNLNQTVAVSTLLAKNADIHAVNNLGETPLHLAIFTQEEKHNSQLLEMLIKANADINAINIEKQTPLHLAVNIQDYEKVQSLLEAKARLDIKDNHNNYPIDIARMKNDKKMCSLLKSVEFPTERVEWFNKQIKKILNPLHIPKGDIYFQQQFQSCFNDLKIINKIK